MASADILFTPLQLGTITLRNRVVMSALTRNRSVPTNVPNNLNLEYYKQRSGAGLIITEGTLVTQQGTEWPNAPGIWNKEQVVAWKNITDAIHADGGHIFVQLWHLGRASHPDMPEQKASGQPVYGPSAIAAKGGKFRQLPGEPGYVVPMPIDDPRKIIALFKEAAINAKEAGFDGVELHGANGYIIHQFLDATSNQRTDEWGGTVENRARLAIETLKALIEIWGPDRVGLKLSPCGGYNDMGMPLQETLDTFSYLTKEADSLKIAYICLSRYLAMMDPVKRGTEHDVVASYTPLIKHAKRFLNTGYTPEEAAKAVESSHADAIVFGTLYIGHPDLAQRIQNGKPLDAQLDFSTLYGHGGDLESERKGYVDYPPAQ